MMRTCAVTREEHSPDDLVRVLAGPDGVVEVDYRAKLGGRGAWLLPRRDVIETAEAKPAILRRALHAEGARTEGLLERVRAANLRAVLDSLSLASRAGCIASGGEQVDSTVRAGDAIALVVATDASPKSVPEARPNLPILTAPLDREALGQRIGKGPRAVLALRGSSVTRTLVRELHRMQELR